MKDAIFRMVLSLFFFVLSAGPIFAADVNLSVASSLNEIVTALSDDFSQMNPAVSFRRNLGGSGTLAKQIESGAPCDIFFSANIEWVDYLKEKKLADGGTIATFAFNELVFVGKPELKSGSLEDVVKLKRVAIGSPKSVPAGQYAMEAFKKAGVDMKLKRKLVMAKDVRECLMYAERGEVDGAFVYKTDAKIMARYVKILFVIPQKLYPRVTYLVALTVTGANNKEAAAFYKFIQSAKAKKVLSRYGFAVK